MRFEVRYAAEASSFDDPAGLLEFAALAGDGRDHTVLVDKETHTIVFSDQCEPEDASLTRHFRPLVTLLNQVHTEHADGN